MTTGPLADVLDEGLRVVRVAAEGGVPVRLLGGVAICLRAGERLQPALRRTPVDIDVITAAGAAPALTAALTAAGYRPDEAFNQLEGYRRLLFYDDVNERQLDVFVRDFAMCHPIPIGDRLTLDPQTLPLAELVLTKLQIVELNAKDRLDLYALLQTQAVAGDDSLGINAAHIGVICARDWGLHRTATLNLARLAEHASTLALDGETEDLIATRISAIVAAIDTAPKTRGWRMRARVGERVRWYEQPEEVAGLR
jgi:hypothetical protein